MKFEKWPTLKTCLEQGILTFIDLYFAARVLKRLNDETEEHASLLAVLFALSRLGHLALNMEKEAFPSTLSLLSPEEDITPLANLVSRGASSFPLPNAWICRFGTLYYLQKNWMHESEILRSLHRLSQTKPTIELFPQKINPQLNQEQKQAIICGINHSLSLLSGGPGTGKTFTAAEFVKVCLASLPPDKKDQFHMILTAPTGKAVAQLEGNLTQILGNLPSIRVGTLHSILKVKSPRHESEDIEPLLADLILVDECSMIDAKMFSRLLLSIPSGARVILIGDKDQLPAVEAGSIFADILESNLYPATFLTHCLRSDRQEILEVAHWIKEGNTTQALRLLSNPKTLDISWETIPEESLQQQVILWERYKEKFPTYFRTPPSYEELEKGFGKFILLSCLRQGPLGVDAVNQYFLQQSLRQVPLGCWWVSPMMITRNSPELELYNGDLGVLVRKVTPHFSWKQFHLEDYAFFPDRKQGFRQMAALALTTFEYSYCLSVHKSQGSEYEEILILMPKGAEGFGREVLYTAITRARKKAILVTDAERLKKTIANSSRKKSGLKERLQCG